MNKYLTIVILLSAFYAMSQSNSFEEQWKENSNRNISELDPIEGIWNLKVNLSVINRRSGEGSGDGLEEIGNTIIQKKGDIYIGKVIQHENFTFKLSKTSSKNLFFYDGFLFTPEVTASFEVELFNNTIIEVEHELGNTEKVGLLKESTIKYTKSQIVQIASINDMVFILKLVKLYPDFNTLENEKKSENKVQSGSGFAITSDGLIVTNNHVINNTTNIKVRGVNGDFTNSFIAKVLVTDEKNDLAIIKIIDPSFIKLGTPPYTIKFLTSEVGLDIFILGYPLTTTMGEEIKLTNGIISAKSGFQGDITSYQISAPIQPGNSGAPLFDKNGNLIGIVNARHEGAENAGYAIKSSYLANLIESLNPSPKLSTQNILDGKSFIEQVKLISKFVYIIEVF
ncbi:MAG: serine protease [Bacteroidales bacterium]|nr:serine protease [Bacteroidales bacterium]